ncbi:hypothetical protein ACWF7H_26940 [Peribacillus butanolivorans]|uniref:hypothetical protein n=1 Tax=Peribacillus butanolivorans TaxID=421767 RepID=UPI0036C1C0B6
MLEARQSEKNENECVTEVYGIIHVTIPQDISNKIYTNTLLLHPSPEYSMSVLDIQYKNQNGECHRIETYPTKQVDNKEVPVEIPEAGKLVFSFPKREITELQIKATMWTPTKAKIAVVPEEKRTKRDTKLKGKFMPWYIKTYGDPNWGPKWPNADIHHELPLKYGETNAMSNLFPLPRDLHQKTVNPWWASY